MSGVVHVKYLLLGGGSAAASAAGAIRQRDPSGELWLVSNESARPYHRPPLARGYLRRELRLEDLFVHPGDVYSKWRVTLRTNVRALSLDVPKRSVTLSDGHVVLFDRLLLATGALPRGLDVPGAPGMPGTAVAAAVGAAGGAVGGAGSGAGTGGHAGGLPGAMVLRTAADADRILHAIDTAAAVPGRRTPVRTVVVGSTMLAAEVAASLSKLGLAVTLATSGVGVMAGLVGAAAERAVRRVLAGQGVEVETQPVTQLAGDGRVQRVVLADGRTLPCDVAVLATGFIPAKDLLRGTTIAAEKAILTNARGETSVEGIYAAGECAAMFDPVFGKHRVLDHWDVSVSRGLIVGAAMADPHDPGFLGVTVHRAELGGPDVSRRVVVIGEPRFVRRHLARETASGVLEFGIDADGRVCSAVAVAMDADAEAAAQRLVRARLDVSGLEDALRDPAAELPDVPE
ncbi:MAG: NAD(P)/FAD-dependent oxidoreductase [Tepidisphaerales bacterium]